MRYVIALISITMSVSSSAADVDPPIDNGNAQRLYNETCIVCHGAGVSGAPRPGIKADWEFRMAYGVRNLTLNAIEGLGPLMPPRGMCSDCSDSDLEAIVGYMVSNLK
jgi:cytochrome c5